MERKARRNLLFFLMTLIVSVLVFLFFKDRLTDQWNITVSGIGDTDYYLLSSSEEGDIWALGKFDKEYILANGREGHCEWINELNTASFPETFLIEEFFAPTGSEVLLETCEIDSKGMRKAYQLYMITEKGETAIPLLNVNCTGETPDEQRDSVVFGSFTQNQGKVNFLVWKGGTAFLYELTVQTRELRLVLSFACDSFDDALVLNGAKGILVCNDGSLSLYSDQGHKLYDIRVNGYVSGLYAGDEGAYYYDSANGTINYVTERDGELYLTQSVTFSSEVPKTVLEDGTICSIEDGHLYRYNGVREDVSEILYGSRLISLLRLLLVFIGCLLSGYILSGILGGGRQISILVKALLFVLLSVLAHLACSRALIVPLQERAVLEVTVQNMETITGMGLRLSEDVDEVGLSEGTAVHTLQALADAGLYDSTITLYSYDTGGFLVIDTTDRTLTEGTVCSGDSLLLKAPSSGTISELTENVNGPVCTCVSTDGIYLFEVKANLTWLVNAGNLTNRNIRVILLLMTAFLMLVLFGIVMVVWFGMRNINRGVYELTEGNYDVVICNPTGDEMESLANSINNLALVLKKSQEELEHVEDKYAPLLPNGLLSLLPPEDRFCLGNGRYAGHELLILTLSIRKPFTEEEQYLTDQAIKQIDELLSKIAEVANQCQAITVSFGCSINQFAFTQDRLDDAMRLAVSIFEMTGVVNLKRAEKGLKEIVIRMMLDYGHVEVGIAGIQSQMYPITLTTCGNHTEKIQLLSCWLDTRILMTEAAMGTAEVEDCRFVGVYDLEDHSEKIYEVFKGDDFLLARRKRETMEEFSKGVEAFYQRDFTGAKRIFLNLVRSGSSKDGPVRYYLNLADMYEQDPPEKVNLNVICTRNLEDF